MPPEYLTTGEFQRWSEDDRCWKHRVDSKLDDQASAHQTMVAEIATLKAQVQDEVQKARRSTADAQRASASAKKWAAIGQVITAIFAGIATLWRS